MNEDEVVIRKLIVHSGNFHADDVMTAALLKTIYPDIEIERVAEVTDDMYQDDVIVADIGGGYYDHHQEDAKRHRNGEKYAACGLVFHDFWDLIFPDASSADYFRDMYIIPIELDDNGVERNPLSIAVKSFVPSWNSKESYNAAFNRAVNFMMSIVKNEQRKAYDTIKGEEKAVEIYNNSLNKELIIFDEFVPWQRVLAPTRAKYVIYPSNRGEWNLQCVPTHGGGHFSRKEYLPDNWEDPKWAPEGMNFIHTGLYLATFSNKEDAIKAGESLI